MTIPRIFSPIPLDTQETCELGEDSLKYLKRVLRLRPGDRLRIFDGYGHEFEAAVKNYLGKTVILELGNPVPVLGEKIDIILAQALPKGKKMDVIVKTTAELGADTVIPFCSARCVSRVEGDRRFLKVARWQKIAQEASRTSHSAYVTKVLQILSFSEMMSAATGADVKLIFWEEESQKTMRDVLKDGAFSNAKKFFVVVGPEGGLTREEVERAKQNHFVSVSLGKQVLKVETAAAVIISILQYERGLFGQELKA